MDCGGYAVSPRSDGRALALEAGVAPCWEGTDCHRIIHFEMANFMSCEFHLKELFKTKIPGSASSWLHDLRELT